MSRCTIFSLVLLLGVDFACATASSLVKYLERHGLKAEQAAAIASQLWNDYDLELTEDLSLLDESDITATATATGLKKVSQIKFLRAYREVRSATNGETLPMRMIDEVVSGKNAVWQPAAFKTNKIMW